MGSYRALPPYTLVVSPFGDFRHYRFLGLQISDIELCIHSSIYKERDICFT